MASPKARGDAIKAAITCNAASPATVVALQALLARDDTAGTGRSATKAVAAKVTKSGGSRARKAEVAVVCEDQTKSLSQREQYALATEVVNCALTTLTSALKPTSAPDMPANAVAGIASTDSATPPRQVLRDRSGNASPGRPSSSEKPKRSSPEASRPSPRAADSYVLASAECARLAFSFLRATNSKGQGVCDKAKPQLEKGMLALVSKLLAHGLDSLATKELYALKRRLENLARKPKAAEAKKIDGGETSPKETLSSLLHLNIDFDTAADLLPLAITHQQYVLRIISNGRKPAVIEESLPYLAPDAPASPSRLIELSARRSDEPAKWCKQLDALSNTILGLCPPTAALSDLRATDSTVCPSPEVVLQLQSAALQIRRLWWKMASHQPDIAKELLDPASKCINAFVRRASPAADPISMYNAVSDAVERLGPLDREKASASSRFAIHNTLCSLAEKADLVEHAIRWAMAMRNDCSGLDHGHARFMIASVRLTSLNVRAHLDSATESELRDLRASLEKGITGGLPLDHDLLVISLAGLSNILLSRRTPACDDTKRIACSAATFALRFSKSYPGKHVDHVQTIVIFALHRCTTTEDLTSWVNETAAKVFLQTGALADVAEQMASKPLAASWSSLPSTIAFSRILKTLLLSRVRSGPKHGCDVFDDETSPPTWRSALLEMQFLCAVELAARTKYHDTLERLLPTLLERLNTLYTVAEYPLRRSRVALVVARLRETAPRLLSASIAAHWSLETDLSTTDPGHDKGLTSYAEDLNAALRVSQLFTIGRPGVDQLRPCLFSWQNILESCDEREDLFGRIDCPDNLMVHLNVISSYLAMLGHDGECVSVRQLTRRIATLMDEGNDVSSLRIVEMARQYMLIGHCDEAGGLLAEGDQMAAKPNSTVIMRIRQRLAQVEYLIATDDLGKCGVVFEELAEYRKSLPPGDVSREQRREYELLHAQGWLVDSRYKSRIGLPHEALGSAKRAVRLLNSVWAAIERIHDTPKDDAAESPSDRFDDGVNSLTQGISKLQLTKATATNNPSQRDSKGAAFWPVVPLLVQALTRLSDTYAHHGLFSEADYYSERAISIAESVGSSVLLSRVRSHRAVLLTSAGRLESAELCLAQSEDTDLGAPCLAAVERLCAKADICAREGDLKESISLYDNADHMLDQLRSERPVLASQNLAASKHDAVPKPAKSSKTQLAAKGPVKRGVRATARAQKDAAPVQRSKRPTEPPSAPSKVMTPSTRNYMLSKWRADIGLRRAIVQIRLGESAEAALTSLELLPMPESASIRPDHVRYYDLMRRAAAALQTDVTLNVLAESTLSFPALKALNHTPSEADHGQSTGAAQGKRAATARVNAKARKVTVTTPDGHDKLLQAARDCLVHASADGDQLNSTGQTHAECAMLSNVSLLLSATLSPSMSKLQPVGESITIELPRVKALQYEQRTVAVDLSSSGDREPWSWPTNDTSSPNSIISRDDFQTEYIDIIPKSWTAVSMCLNDDCSELYIVRYNAGQTPLVLRLPFSRHKPEGLDQDDEPFDYHRGKAELQDIIESSNYSCHNTAGLEAKGAKTNWWAEREALDRRLQELLINIENIWLGGFKGVLSPRARREDVMGRFRKSLDDTLDRHLPSRRAFKGRGKRLELDDKVLDLFIGLGDDDEGEIDLDDPLSDLLYFVVDMLQFQGEHNAYDEIDFDSMTVEVLDALRAYHAEAAEAEATDRHLILVLDRRLQAIPWESLPYLENLSVSRVGSMLSLRQCILAMRGANGQTEDSHAVSRRSGMCILNPSSDLKSTQAALTPALTALTSSTHTEWRTIANEAPSEEDFSTALQTKPITLYFGHGAGSQYIRPRTIKRLPSCSEVVWLMGCSSGAVAEHGELESTAVPLAYLLAGHATTTPSASNAPDTSPSGSRCLAVVATLWDVTDKDIDRFSLAVGEEWGLWPASGTLALPAKTSRQRGPASAAAAPVTPPRAARTPKIPRVRKTPAPTKTPGRSRSQPPREAGGGRTSLVQAVSRSRDACYLRYLNGAAPVVFGVPVYLGD